MLYSFGAVTERKMSSLSRLGEDADDKESLWLMQAGAEGYGNTLQS
jgi:hypothetical protein